MDRRILVRIPLAGLLLLALLGSGVWLAYGRFSHTYAIKRQLQEGEQWRYQLTQSFQVGQQSTTLNIGYTEAVKKVNPDGSAVVERVLQGDPQTLRALCESAAPLGEIPTRTLWQVHPDGRETPLSGKQAPLTLGSASARLLPPHPVRIGEQWERESQLGSLRTRFRCRLQGLTKVDGAPYYQIVAHLESLPGSLPQVHDTITCYIDRLSGWTRKEEGTITMTSGSLQMSSQIHIHGQRVSENPNRRGTSNG